MEETQNTNSDTSVQNTIPKKWIVWGVIGIILIWILGSIPGTYNTLVQKDENVKTNWSQVENQYQRRLDLIDNLVQTVKGSANFEKSTLEAVVSARASATKTNIDVNNVGEIAEFQKQQSGLSQALSRLISITENYPDLKASQQFSDLMVQLEGTENRISTERGRFNEAVQDFNTYLRSFPRNIIGGFFGFQTKQRFEATDGAEVAPKVDFGDMGK